MAGKFTERFSLDYLTPNTGREAPRGKGLDAAVMLQGGKLMGALQKAPDREARLFDLIDATAVPMETALKAVEAFRAAGLVEIVKQDLKGNHLLRLTAEGAALA
jgi:hypothetical protein